MGGRSSDSDTERSRKGKKVSRSKRSRSRSSSTSVSSNSSGKRRYQSSSKYDSRSRSSTKNKSSKRYRSRSRDRKEFSRSSYSSRQDHRYRQRSRSPSRDKSKGKESDSSKKLNNSSTNSSSKPSNVKSTEDQIKLKMQLALKAAADADELLRQQGVLKAKEWGRNADQDNIKPIVSENKWPREPALSVKEQIEHVKALEEINGPGFQQQSFVSGRLPSVAAKETEKIVETHDSAMYGGTSDPDIIPAPKPAPISTFKNVCVAHENLFEDIAVKEERWLKKLMLMRQRKLNGEAMH